MWMGDAVGYTALHSWVKRRLHRPKRCQSCGKVKRLDLANISQKYLRDLSDWEWLCRRCHMLKDGRLAEWKSWIEKRRTRPMIPCAVCGKWFLKRRPSTTCCSQKCRGIRLTTVVCVNGHPKNGKNAYTPPNQKTARCKLCMRLAHYRCIGEPAPLYLTLKDTEVS